MSTPDADTEMRKSFKADSPPAARDAASAWLRDFSAHGPLDIRSISVSEEEDHFVATVIYSNASIEITPRHFPARLPQAEPLSVA
jgi:hypothetical protein